MFPLGFFWLGGGEWFLEGVWFCGGGRGELVLVLFFVFSFLRLLFLKTEFDFSCVKSGLFWFKFFLAGSVGSRLEGVWVLGSGEEECWDFSLVARREG